MDREIVQEKLETLRHCVARVELKCPVDADRLLEDADAQDIIALNLARSVQLCVDIAAHILASLDVRAPATMAQAFESLHTAGVLEASLMSRMKGAVGFRNIAVHAYDKIDWNLVHNICRSRLVDFRDFAASVSRYLSQQ